MKYLAIILISLCIIQSGFAIDNCKTVNGGDSSKCDECNDGFSGPSGASAPFVSCSMDNCKTANGANAAKCDECNEGFSGPSGASAPFVSCSMNNCKTANGSDASKCDECESGFSDPSKEAAPFDSCPMTNCKTMNTDAGKEDKCSECLVGFTAQGSTAGEHTGCSCSPDNIKKDASGSNICVKTLVQHCAAYADIETCKTCEAQHTLSEDKKTCTAAGSSSGSIISFSLVLAILAITLI